MAETIQRDDKQGLLLRKTKSGKKYLVKRLPNGTYITIKK